MWLPLPLPSLLLAPAEREEGKARGLELRGFGEAAEGSLAEPWCSPLAVDGEASVFLLPFFIPFAAPRLLLSPLLLLLPSSLPRGMSSFSFDPATAFTLPNNVFMSRNQCQHARPKGCPTSAVSEKKCPTDRVPELWAPPGLEHATSKHSRCSRELWHARRPQLAFAVPSQIIGLCCTPISENQSPRPPVESKAAMHLKLRPASRSLIQGLLVPLAVPPPSLCLPYPLLV